MRYFAPVCIENVYVCLYIFSYLTCLEYLKRNHALNLSRPPYTCLLSQLQAWKVPRSSIPWQSVVPWGERELTGRDDFVKVQLNENGKICLGTASMLHAKTAEIRGTKGARMKRRKQREGEKPLTFPHDSVPHTHGLHAEDLGYCRNVGGLESLFHKLCCKETKMSKGSSRHFCETATVMINTQKTFGPSQGVLLFV